MSESAQVGEQISEPEIHAQAHGHPTPRDYVRVAVILGIITAVEVIASYVALPEVLFIGGLIAMAVAKFMIVAGYYMHLNYDSRMFRQVFGFGIVLAVTVFLVVLGLFILSPAETGSVEALAPPGQGTPA